MKRTESLTKQPIQESMSAKDLLSPTSESNPSISEDILQDDRVGRILAIVQEAWNVPKGWKATKWKTFVARKHGTNRRTLYKWKSKVDQSGIFGLKHRKSNRGKPKNWTPEALEYWFGLKLKQEYRKLSDEALFEILKEEASRRGWRIGSLRSAIWWFDRKIPPQLVALQRGGVRALDNALPPILRDYSDLQPFEIVCGDQHRSNFWVTNEDSGNVFRFEVYRWHCLRTRLVYGVSFRERYDKYSMGLALRVGIKKFGLFGSLYTDHGKPEQSNYIREILEEMQTLGLLSEQTVGIPSDLPGINPEEISSEIRLVNHRRATVRNPKAKLIESTNNSIEKILINQIKVPGYCKRLGDSQEEQEIDQKEIERLAAAGKLLTAGEFVVSYINAVDYYNFKKPHRGVLQEWAWQPRPKSATPMDCLIMYIKDGWRPKKISEEVVDLIFLPKTERTVNRGRIGFNNLHYESRALIPIEGKRVQIRFDPLDQNWVLVFYRGEFLCRAEPVEYSSMKDPSLARRKIEEKRGLRRQFMEEYRRLTSPIPDLRQYSRVPAIEKAAAAVGKQKKDELLEHEELYRKRSAEELAAEVAQIRDGAREMQETASRLPSRPDIFLTEFERFAWCINYETKGGNLTEEDQRFMKNHWGKLDKDSRRYWEKFREVELQKCAINENP